MELYNNGNIPKPVKTLASAEPDMAPADHKPWQVDMIRICC